MLHNRNSKYDYVYTQMSLPLKIMNKKKFLNYYSFIFVNSVSNVGGNTALAQFTLALQQTISFIK